jgi:Leucine-rich repeat (LRR) protein
MIEIPTSIGQLAKLKTLNFYWDSRKLKGKLPASMGNLASLEHFQIDRSGLEGGIPEELGKLVNLRTFRLRGSSITGEVPASFAGLAYLKTFDVNGNNLSGKLPKLSKTLSSCALGVNNLTCHHPSNAACVGNGVQGVICGY